MTHQTHHNAPLVMVTLSGPLAMISCEPRQARKGATVAVTSCAGVWLDWVATLCYSPNLFESVLKCCAVGCFVG